MREKLKSKKRGRKKIVKEAVGLEKNE